MDQNQLLSSTVELGLDLLEQNGIIVPFCKAVDEESHAIYYSPDSEFQYTARQAYDSVLFNVKRDLAVRRLKGLAFCFDTSVRLSGMNEMVDAIEVEVHYKGLPATIWYFPYTITDGRATVQEYYTNPAAEDFFA